MRSLVKQFGIGVLVVLLLAACGSSDDNSSGEETKKALLQFYNGSGDSALISLRDTDKQGFGTAGYGDATNPIELVSGTKYLQLYRTEPDGNEVIVSDVTTSLNDNKKTLIIMSGDFSEPAVNQYEFEVKELKNHFRLFASSVIQTEGSYDLYMNKVGSDFAVANLLATIHHGVLDELNFWDGDSESADFDTGLYNVYITEPGSDQVLFESSGIDFRASTEFVLIVRESSGAIEEQLKIDIVTNSSTVTEYSHVDAGSQYRVYNSLNEHQVDVSLMGDSSGNISNEFTVAAGSISGFTKIDFGDYRVSAKSTSNDEVQFNSRLVTLNQGVSKVVVIYQDADSKLTSLDFIESNQPQVFDKHINVVNLQNTLQNVSLYFVRNSETVDTAKLKIHPIEFAKTKRVTVPRGAYELIALHTDENGSKTLLDRTPLLTIDENRHYVITIETDLSTASGYKLSLL